MWNRRVLTSTDTFIQLDGKPLEASSRITNFFNFGYVALTIKFITVHDRGVYTCVARNALGEAQTTAKLTVISKQDILLETQHPEGLEKIRYLEDDSRYARKEETVTSVTIKPRFLGPLKGTNKIVEGQKAHFEIRLEPQNDSTLRVEWYFNGKVLMQVMNNIAILIGVLDIHLIFFGGAFSRRVASTCSTTLAMWPWIFWMCDLKMLVLTP